MNTYIWIKENFIFSYLIYKYYEENLFIFLWNYSHNNDIMNILLCRKKGGNEMCIYIGIEDLAANALIELLKKKDERFVSYEDLEEYGAEVVRLLNDKGEKAVLVLSRENTNNMFRDYSNMFEEKYKDSKLGIALKENIEVDDLIDKFRGYLAWEVLLAFVNVSSLSKLGVVA